MANLSVRNVPDEIVRALRIRAARHGRSAEEEHRLILEQALEPAMREHFWKEADALRRRTRQQRTNSGRLQRKMRDER